MSKLLLIDGNSYLHRAFHAYPEMTSPKGAPTNAVYGTLKMMENLVSKVNPTHFAVCLDSSKKTFRNSIYSEYKANRKPAPEALVSQFVLFRQVLSALDITFFEDEQYEADDLLGTVSQRAEGLLTMIATSDRDAIQLIDCRTTVLLYKNKGYVELSDGNLIMEFRPDQMVDIKALAGDASDNIPGVPGVGKKTAIELVNKYGSAFGVIENSGEIKGKLGEKIRANIDSIKMSYKLAVIKRDCPIDVNFDNLKLGVDIEIGDFVLASLGIRTINLNKFLLGEQQDASGQVALF
ncbi:5'-3' exonuclease [Pelotomaculum propionicicum]|uniref:5'-3' exonuclease n=1 Tax=Pelotomaculum propionicicum TaxID=258475 RepID=UPI003B7BE372